MTEPKVLIAVIAFLAALIVIVAITPYRTCKEQGGTQFTSAVLGEKIEPTVRVWAP